MSHSFSSPFVRARIRSSVAYDGLERPNGLAFSPDKKYFYVDNWDEKTKAIVRYEVNPDGTLSNGEVFFDMTNASGEDALDGRKIDEKGNLYVSGPGGLWIISPEGKHLRAIVGPSTRTTCLGER